MKRMPLWPLAALGLILLFNLAFTPGFFHIEVKDGRLFGSVIDILKHASPVMLTGIGMALVIATGGVDLSVGAVVAIAGAVAAMLITHGHSLGASFAAALGLALVAGVWNGALVAWLDIQPIVATLVLMVAGRGMALMLTGGQHVRFSNRWFAFVGGGSVLGLPTPVVIAAAVLGATALLTRRTAMGLFVESVGNNPTASRYAGINEKLVKVFVYAASGFCAGIAGLIAAADIKEADASSAGLYLELDAILAVVIGGTALTGGRFYLLGTIVGALIIQTLTTTILTRNVPVNMTLVVKGAVVIIVCLLQSPKFQSQVSRLWRRQPA